MLKRFLVLAAVLSMAGFLNCDSKVKVEASVKWGDWWGSERSGKKGLKFFPTNLFDSNKKTAWCIKGRKGSIKIKFHQTFDFDELYFVNGWAKNKKSQKNNLSAKILKLNGKRIKLKPGNAQGRKQRVKFKMDNVETIELAIQKVHKKKGVNDTCISDLYFKKTGLLGDTTYKIALHKPSSSPNDYAGKVKKSGIVLVGENFTVHRLCPGGNHKKATCLALAEGTHCDFKSGAKWTAKGDKLNFDGYSLSLSKLFNNDKDGSFNLSNRNDCAFDPNNP